MEEQARGGRGGLLAGLAVALLVLGPLLVRRGWVLTYDMVFVPDPPLDGRLLGLGPALARAVPSDLLVALPSQLVPGDLVQRAVLLAVLAGGAWGAGRLVGGGLLPGAVAGVAYAWTAATAERLVLGQWALLLSLSALPWVVDAALRGGARRLLLSLAVAACGSPAGALLAGATAVGLQRRRADALRAAGCALLVCLPWAVPSLLRPGGVPGDPAGLAAFAPRADSPLGAVGSVLTLGGVWSADVVPPGRDTFVAVLGLALVALAAWGLPRHLLTRLGPVAAVGLLVAVAPLVPGLDALAETAVREVPGGGLLRDGQKYAAPYALLVALGLGHAAARLPRAFAVLVLVTPVALLPGFAWAVSGRLAPPVAYPAEVGQVRRLVATAPGAVLSLPWTAYRRPAWNDRRTVLDPLPRLLDRHVVVDDDLVLADRTVQGEDPVAAGLGPLVSGTGPLTRPLAAAGVGWVVVARDEPGAVDPRDRLAGAVLRLDGPALQVWQLPGAVPRALPGPPALPVVVVDTALVLLLLGLGVRAAATVGRTSTQREELDP